MNSLLIAGIGAAVAAGMGVTILFFVYQRRLGQHRGVSRSQFVAAFSESEVPSKIAGTVYDYYKSQVISKDFSISPDDDYESVLSEGDEDIDDDARSLIRLLGFSVPENYAGARSERRIRTLRDMVLWLHWVEQHQHFPEQQLNS